MSFYNRLSTNQKANLKVGSPLWKLNLSEEQFIELQGELQFGNEFTIDPRDAALYFAYWWKYIYESGIPKKQSVFNSIGGNIRYNLDSETFYKIAQLGAKIFGIKWIRKQKRLKFRTLLLQGGLPFKHITANQGAYQDFLLAVYNEFPNSIDDFRHKSEIIRLLPVSGRNKSIYENCLQIVKAYRNEDNLYEDLFNTHETLKIIGDKLRIQAKKERKTRKSYPKIYWLLKLRGQDGTISLFLDFADEYSSDELSDILGREVAEREYQFYVNDNLLCVFRKTNKGSYKTDWYGNQKQLWDGDENLPQAYVIVNNHKLEVSDLIQNAPDLNEPGLWSKYDENEWRMRGDNNTSTKEGAVLFPGGWETKQLATEVLIKNRKLKWITFEGEISLTKNAERVCFQSGVQSFSWIIESHKPSWLKKTNLPIVRHKPIIRVYNEDGQVIEKNKFKVWVKDRFGMWEDYEKVKRNELPLGYIKMKIKYLDIESQGAFYNIGNFILNLTFESFSKTKVIINENPGFFIELNETEFLDISKGEGFFNIEKQGDSTRNINGIRGCLIFGNQRKLIFETIPPFKGMTLINKQNEIIKQFSQLSFNDLYGVRIIGSMDSEMAFRFRNVLKPEVQFVFELNSSEMPLRSYQEKLLQLYMLDPISINNKVRIELINGKNILRYEISPFSHYLDTSEALENKFRLFESDDLLELFAIPLNCIADKIQPISLFFENKFYSIPDTDTPTSKQFVVISSKEDTKRLMPVYVNMDESYSGTQTKQERIYNYHEELFKSSFEEDIWKVVLAYYSICVENELPFSTFDQLTAISRSSVVAAKAFFFLAVNRVDIHEYIDGEVPQIEKDLGFCFHWIEKNDWLEALKDIEEVYGQEQYQGLMYLYFQNLNMGSVFNYILGFPLPDVLPITQSEINNARSRLGNEIVKVMPKASPKVLDNYRIPINENSHIRLLLQSSIAVAESIAGLENDFPLWGGSSNRDTIRRNIQYVQYLDSELLNSKIYKQTIEHTLKVINK